MLRQKDGLSDPEIVASCRSSARPASNALKLKISHGPSSHSRQQFRGNYFPVNAKLLMLQQITLSSFKSNSKI